MSSLLKNLEKITSEHHDASNSSKISELYQTWACFIEQQKTSAEVFKLATVLVKGENSLWTKKVGMDYYG